MALLDQVLGAVVANRMGRGGFGGGGFGGGMSGGLGGGLGGAVAGGMLGSVLRGGGRGGGLSKALLLLLAGKFAMDYMGRQNAGAQPSAGGAAGGGVLGGGGLGGLIEQFRRNGKGDIIDSWLKPGPNQRIAPNQLADALGDDTVQSLSQQTGMPRDELLEDLSETLPDAVDQMTPDGQLPDDDALRPPRT